MPKTSAGILLYRRRPQLQILLGHPGGPLWAKKDAGIWSIPKGELDAGEDPLAAARREFAEETPWIHLDIAGTAWENERKPYMSKGPTGIAIRTLINYVCNHAAKKG